MRANRLANEIESGNTNLNARNNAPKNPRNGAVSLPSQAGPGLSIKGSAGPFTVHASNFAAGTTEADIESALHSDVLDANGTSCLISCELVTTRPAVVVEMVFSEKSVADRIINKFNNLKADGRLLKVEYVRPDVSKDHTSRRPTATNSNVAQSIEPGPDPDLAIAVEGDIDMDAVEPNPEYNATSYDHDREAADRDRRDRDRDRDGFVPNSKRDERRDDRPREDRDRRREDRPREDRDRDERSDRDRERDRDRDRDREGGRDRDRDYDRREPQSTQSYNNGDYSQRPQGNAYGNGFNRPPRGNYGGYSGRGNYNYPRGGGAGYVPRGTFRGGYAR